MENFKHRNKELEFWTHTGVVLGGQNKYSETHVSSSGGGGYVGANGGHVDAPRVSSSVVTNHEFWIRKEDGTEKAIQLHGCDIPLREGHKITVLLTGYTHKTTGYYTALINHSANEHRYINDADKLNEKLKIDVMTGKSLLIGLALFVPVMYLGYEGYYPTDNFVQSGLLASGGFMAFRFVYKFARIISLRKRLRAHLDTVVNSLY